MIIKVTRVNRLKKWAVYLSFLYIAQNIISCATIRAPPGGPKDIKPPKVISTYPAQQSLNFNGKRVSIFFDEKINTAKLKDKILITPFYDGEFELDGSGKKVELTFSKPFLKNETYTINFSNGLIDMNEGNTIKNYKLVFSTGSTIDSLHLTGRVVDTYTKRVEANAVVALYRVSDTTNPELKKPYYLTYSNDKGIYSLTNVKQGNYILYGFNDINKNYLYDIRKEKIGFIMDTLKLDSLSIDSLKLELDRNDVYKPALANTKNDNEYRFIFDEGIYQYKIESDKRLHYDLSDSKKELIFYKTELCEDSIPVKIFVSDSSYNDTTLYTKIVQSMPKKFSTYKDIIKKIEPDDKYQMTDSLPIKIYFNQPLITAYDSSILINTDSLSYKYLSFNKDFRSNHANTLYTYSYKIKRKPKEFIKLEIPNRTLFTLTGDTNKRFTMKYKPFTPEIRDIRDISIATLVMKTQEKNYIIEILNEKYEPIATYYNEKKIVYQDIKPGKYSVRIIIDSNNDKKWDFGNYRNKQKSEKVIIYDKAIVVIQNWDIEEQVFEF